MFLRKLRTWFVAGLVVLLPVWLSFFAVVWLFTNLDAAVKEPLQRYADTLPVLGLPGLGVLLGLLVILLAGWLASLFLGRKLIDAGERLMLRIPVVKAIYAAVKQVTEAVFNHKEQAFSQVVLVEYPRAGLYCLGFVAGELAGTGLARVWIPPGPWPSAGPVTLIPLDQLVELPMKVEDGLKMIVSAGVLAPRDGDGQAIAGAVAELRRRRGEAG
jgi:uncharacterized membrane protein